MKMLLKEPGIEVEDWQQVQEQAQVLLDKKIENIRVRSDANRETKYQPLLHGLICFVEELSPGSWWDQAACHSRKSGPEDDWRLGILYAGLTVLCRDIHLFLKEQPTCEIERLQLFDDVIADVQFDESWSRENAFPNFTEEQARFVPSGIVSKLCRPGLERAITWPLGHKLKPLKQSDIVYEWTVIPGTKLFTSFMRKSSSRLEKALANERKTLNGATIEQGEIPFALFEIILKECLTDHPFWYPLAVYLGFLMNRTGFRDSY